MLPSLRKEKSGMRLAGVVGLVLLTAGPAEAQLYAAVVPPQRTIMAGEIATAFAVIINAGPFHATGCSIAPAANVTNFVYQTTDPATNALTGTPNTPVDIPPGGAQPFMFALTAAPTASPISPRFACTNTSAAPSIQGVNTFTLKGRGPNTRTT